MLRRKTSRAGHSAHLETLENRKLLASGIGTFVPRTATWSLRSTASAGPADVGVFQFGASVPVVGDWNGDGRDDIGTFNPATAVWSLRYGASAGTPDAGVFVFGKRGTLPVVGDWNGDGRDDIGVYVAKTATWSLRLGASAGPANAGTFVFGAKNAAPVAGDWDGDGRDGIGTFDGSATWTLRQTATAGAADAGTFKFGAKGTVPVVGDWNGDKKDGIAVVATKTATWSVRQTASAGAADVGTFVFGAKNAIPLAGDFKGPAAPTQNTLTTVTLKPLDLNLLGLEVRTSPITVTLSAKSGDGKLLGNLLNSVDEFVNTDQVSAALSNVLGTAADLANGGSLSVAGLGSGAFDTAAPATSQVLELFVAPVHLDTLGVQVDTSPVRLSVSAHAGDGLVLGNALTMLSNLFNPPLPSAFDVDAINLALSNLLGQVNSQFGLIPAANISTAIPTAGRIMTFAVPGIDLDLLGLQLESDPVLVDATAQSGDGRLLGNVWATAMNTLDATPEKMAQMTNTANAVLARVFGVLNAAELSVSSPVVAALPPAIQALLSPTLFAPAGSSAPILDLTLSGNGITPPTSVDVLGLHVASNNVNARVSAVTGDGQILGNLLYNAANLTNTADPTALALISALATKSTAAVAPITGGVAGVSPASAALFNVTLPPIDIDLLGLEVQTDPIQVKMTAQYGDSLLLGNVLRGYTSLVNTTGVSNAVNNVLSTAVNLVNSVDLNVAGVGSGVFSTSSLATVTPIFDSFIAPIQLDLLGAQAETSPIHLTMTAHSGDGLVLGNVLTAMSNLFNPPLQSSVDLSALNSNLQQLLADFNAHAPGITPAPLPPANVTNVLAVTMPGLNLDLLGMGLKTDAIVVDAAANAGDGLLLGDVYTAALNTLDVTSADLHNLSASVNAVLAKVMGVFNSSTLVLPAGVLASLPSAYQTLANPTLINPTSGATTSILDLGLASPDAASRTATDVLGLTQTTSNLHLQLTARTGDGLILGNMLFNLASLLNPGSSSSYLYLLPLL